jgi:mannose-6-phosphate isomerase-like protein (cupin superfamily)
MTTPDKKLWQGLAAEARTALIMRDYGAQTFSQQLAGAGIDAGKLASADRSRAEIREAWIPGVEIFSRTIYPQWANARMFAQTAKGFHVHPPSIPEDAEAGDWFRRCFVQEAENYSLRRYEHEQWDVMFFVQGVAEMILRDVRAGMPSRTMRFFVDGDNHRGANNVGVVVPPGVAHAIRVEGSEDVIMVYGTSTSFRPDFEGRIASDVETATLPDSWQQFLK